jgi:hypothetical protein
MTEDMEMTEGTKEDESGSEGSESALTPQSGVGHRKGT